MKGLDERSALKLLRMHSSLAAQEESDRNAALTIIARVQNHPLALTLIGAYMERSGMGHAEYLANYLREPRSVRLELNSLIERSYCKLSERHVLLLSLASCFAGRGIAPNLLMEAFRRATGSANREDFDEALGALFRLFLMESERLADGERRVRLGVHDIIRTFVYERIPAAERETIQDCVAAALTQCIAPANEQMEWHGVRREIPHCHAVAGLYENGSNIAAILRFTP